MADNILRLKVESTGYGGKLKSVAEGLSRYIDKCRETGKTLETVEKEALRYAQSLGRMETVSRSIVCVGVQRDVNYLQEGPILLFLLAIYLQIPFLGYKWGFV